MYHTEPPTDKTVREWYMNSSRVAACALRNEQAVRAYGPGRTLLQLQFTVLESQNQHHGISFAFFLFGKFLKYL